MIVHAIEFIKRGKDEMRSFASNLIVQSFTDLRLIEPLNYFETHY